jgi:non-ribosomal peptide synthetase component F
LSAELRDVAKRERVPFALVALTAYCAVMARWCNQPDLLVSFVSNGRHRPELHTMIGNLVFHLHLRVEVNASDTVLDLLKQVGEEYASASDHQDFGWVPTFIPECADTYTDISLYFNWVPSYWLEYPALSDDPTTESITVEPFPLSIGWPNAFRPVFRDTPDGIEMPVRCRDSGPFLETVHRFGDSIVSFAEHLAHRPHTRIADVASKL